MNCRLDKKKYWRFVFSALLRCSWIGNDHNALNTCFRLCKRFVERKPLTPVSMDYALTLSLFWNHVKRHRGERTSVYSRAPVRGRESHTRTHSHTHTRLVKVVYLSGCARECVCVRKRANCNRFNEYRSLVRSVAVAFAYIHICVLTIYIARFCVCFSIAFPLFLSEYFSVGPSTHQAIRPIL